MRDKIKEEKQAAYEAEQRKLARRFWRKHPELKQDPDDRDVRRFDGRRVLTGYEQMPGDVAIMYPPGGNRTVEQRALVARLERVGSYLPEHQQDLLRRVYWEGQSQKEIAAALGVSQQAVSQRLATAERALKRAIAEHGGKPEVLELEEGDL